MTKMLTEGVGIVSVSDADKSGNQELLKRGVRFFTDFRSFTEDCVTSDDYTSFLFSNESRIRELLLELEEIRGLIGGLPNRVSGKDLHHISFRVRNNMDSVLGLSSRTGSTVESVPMVFRTFLQTCLRNINLTQSVSVGELIAMNSLAGVMLNLGLPVLSGEWTDSSMI